jgi:hypothetical protein
MADPNARTPWPGIIQDVNANALVVNADGSLPVGQVKATTGAQTSVAANAASVTLLAANTNRKGATIYNDSSAVLYLLLATGPASATANTLQIVGGGYYEVPYGYTGIIVGIWASATGNARVTELT